MLSRQLCWDTVHQQGQGVGISLPPAHLTRLFLCSGLENPKSPHFSLSDTAPV